MDLVNEAFNEDDTLGLFVRETIGDAYYTGPENFVVNMTVDDIQQWNLQGSEQHPFHMHVNHMQFVNVDGPSLVPGWNQVGDWVDTVSSESSMPFFGLRVDEVEWGLCQHAVDCRRSGFTLSLMLTTTPALGYVVEGYIVQSVLSTSVMWHFLYNLYAQGNGVAEALPP